MEYAGIEKEIVSIGVSTRIEIWSKASWAEYNDSDVNFDEIAEKMSELGIKEGKSMEFKHISIMAEQCIEGLNIEENGIYVDCTLGGGGHSSYILQKLSAEGRLIGIDQDMEAINAAKARLSQYKNVTYVNDNFRNIKNVLNNLGIEKVDGILADLGVSSYQLDNADRGLRYIDDAPLDMRMNRDQEFMPMIL